MAAFSGLEYLATAVVALDEGFVVRYANPAAENLLDVAAKSLIGQPFPALFIEQDVLSAANRWDYAAQNVTSLRAGRDPRALS